jgi:hypothetical protein
VTLPAQSPPEATPSEGADEPEGTSSPVALIAVVGVSALVVILCVIGATLSGLFSFLGSTEPAADTALAPEVVAAAAEPVTTFPDGQYLVLRDVRAGTYEATVPAGSPGCSWERRSTTDGTASAVLESGEAEVGDKIVVNIKPTDKIFHSQGCGTWDRTAEE